MMLRSFLRAASPARAAFAGTRAFSSGAETPLRQRLEELVPQEIERVKGITSKYGNESLGSYTVSQAYGGMRGITGLVYETSLLDPVEGIRFRGLSIPECQEQLPAAKDGQEPIPESLLWLLLCNEVPTESQVESVTADLASRATLPGHIEKMIDSFPKNMHPMTQFSSAIAAMNTESEFAQAYQDGIHKSQYWKPVYEDAMNLIARLPLVAARIYRSTYFGDAPAAPNPAKDWAGNFANMLGYDDPQFEELMRLYQVIHSDHEGGNVSAHTVRLVGSALSDPYLSFAAGMTGLAGPLHGLANQECLKFIKDLQSSLGAGPYTNDQVAQACWDVLNSGKVIPGFGHAVLRKTDPRYMCQREFALKFMKDDPLIALTAQIYEVVPGVLEEQGKAKNPWPNVDAHSGVLLQHYNFTQEEYYTVLFGVSRALGTLSSLVWDRALGLPIERPKSVTSEWVEKTFGKK